MEDIENATRDSDPDLSVSFHSFDYIMFVGMMLASALIGVYYGFFQKQNSVSDYLLGGQAMGVFPVAMSLIASNVSGLTILGIPSEMYVFGTQFFLITLMIIPMTWMVMHWFIPMFYNLQCTSSFEYLEHRFNRTTRQLASVLYTFVWVLYMPVIIYIPCLALNQVTGISVHYISPIACFVCVFYTTLGGLKAVVWTDALQLLLLCLASIVVMILGLIRAGGPGVVWERSLAGGRLELFNTFVASISTLLFHLGTDPSAVQRYLSVPSISAARKTCIWLTVGYVLSNFLTCASGLIMYATYYYCDPLHKDVGVVKRQDQLVPYYVMDVASSFPGLAGLFVAGVFSAALSTMSSSLNTLSGTIFKDFVEEWCSERVSDKRASLYMKCISCGLGVISVIMILIVEKLGGVLQVAMSLASIYGGVSGLFLLGMFVPCVNPKGACAGAITSVVTMSVIVAGNSWAQAAGTLYYPTLPTRTDGCGSGSTINGSSTTESPPEGMPHEADVFPPFKVSFMYFGPLGVLINVVVAIVVSYATGANKLSDLNPDFFSPSISRWLPKGKKQKKFLETTAGELSKTESRRKPKHELNIYP